MLRRGLYAITSESLCASETLLIGGVAAALRGGAVQIQYRDKWNDAPTRRHYAQSLLKLCRTHAAPLIINDDPALAADIGAEGVHLGRADATLAEARRILGAQAIIGLTCGTDIERARAAAAGGAGYAAFGRFFPSRTKPDAPAASLQVLEQARQLLPQGFCICAIGGITPDNAATLVHHGANLLAAVEGVFGAADIENAARGYARLF